MGPITPGVFQFPPTVEAAFQEQNRWRKIGCRVFEATQLNGLASLCQSQGILV